jgi:hypothetical protein
VGLKVGAIATVVGAVLAWTLIAQRIPARSPIAGDVGVPEAAEAAELERVPA